MGRTQAHALAINEGVALLDELAPSRLADLRTALPQLASELQVGIIAGSGDEEPAPDAYLREKASVMMTALTEVADAAERKLMEVSGRVRNARRQRLVSQALVLVGSSSSLATLALSQTRAAVAASVLTLLAALGNLAADYLEKLLNPQAGNIYEMFQRLGEGKYRAKSLAVEIAISLKYGAVPEDLRALVGEANKLCEDLNGGLVQILVL
jgi:hypothetical protein